MKEPTKKQEIEKVPAHAIELISRAEIDIQIATARRYPRSLQQVKLDMIEFATLDEETAASCFYSVPRGTKTINGPSVRLAEIAMSCYSNIRAGNRIIEVVTDGQPHVLVQAMAIDLEKNNAVTVEKRRRIVGKKAKGGAIDEDDINLAANAGSAIAFRDAVFKVVPGSLVKAAYEAARKVAIGDTVSLNDRRAKCIEAFAKMGVSAERVIASVHKKSIEEIGLEELGTLLGVFTAIKDGATSVDDAFPAPPKKTAEKPEFVSPEDEAKAPPHTETPEEEADRIQREQDEAWYAGMRENEK
jgi:hypothetical protein